MHTVPAILLPAAILVGFMLGCAGYAQARRDAFAAYVAARQRQRQALHLDREQAQLDAMGEAFLAESRQ